MKIERAKALMHCRNTNFIYHNEFSKYMKIETATSQDVFDYLFDVKAIKFILEKGKKYLLELFRKLIQEHL